MIKFRKLSRDWLWLIAMCGVWFFSTVGWMHFSALRLSYRVRQILAQSQSVRLVEYRTYNMTIHQNSGPLAEKVFAKDEFPRITQAMPLLGICDSPKCGFIPHHSLICSQQDGSSVTIRICLSCDGIQFENEPYHDLPVSWHDGIIALLNECGMPYKNRDAYQLEWDAPSEK